MTAQQLKSSILQMAVQGKLVPQNPDDEPASVLLERIKAEKQELINAGKIKKSKKESEIFRGASRNIPYTFCEQIGKEIRDISEEIPFEIPDSWEWIRLGRISSLVTKGTTPRGGNVSYLDNGIGFLRAENVAGMDFLDTSKMNYIDEETHTGFLKRSILCENDLLITIAGTLGRTAIVRRDNLPLNANQAISIVRLVSPIEFDLMYLICALNSPLIQKMLTEQKKITAIPNLTLEIIADCFIPIPPLSEQHRIVTKIEELFPFIEKYAQAETQLTALNTSFPEMLKKSILQEAVQGKLVPQNPDDEPASVLLERIIAEKRELIKQGKIKKDKHESVIITRDKIPYEIVDGKERCIVDEVPFEIPENWCWCRLSDIVSFIGGFAYSSSDFIQKSNNQVLRLGNVKNDKLKLSAKPVFISDELANNTVGFKCRVNDILLTMTGTRLKRDYFFTVRILNETSPLFINQRVGCLRAFYSNMAHWLTWILKSETVLSQVFQHETGTANQGNLGAENILKTMIPLPPIAEQNRIVAKIEELMKYCEKL